MPTLALASRAALLLRAVESVIGQHGVRAVPLLVVNGALADEALVHELAARRQIHTIRLPEPSLPAALMAGRLAVDTEFFAELDDDDLLLPDALRLRLEPFADDPELGAVVSNGTIRHGGRDCTMLENVSLIAPDPLSALGAGNWLCPGAALLRTAAVTAELFAGMPAYLEWTYLAVRLAQHCKLAFLDEPTFIHYTDTPERTWTSDACKLGLPSAFDRILGELDLPRELRSQFARRRASAANGAAQTNLVAGRLRDAWAWHVRCLAGVGGWRYLPFTRKLIKGHLQQGLLKTEPVRP